VLLAVACATAAGAAPAGAVLGGRTAAPGTLRGAARIDLPDETCSGTLIAPRLVLTALHCVQAPQDGVPPDVLGRRATVTVGNPNHDGRTQLRGVGAVFVAPQLTPPPAITGQVDAVILALNRTVATPPLALTPGADAAAALVPGAPLVLAGFGAVLPGAPSAPSPAGQFLKQAALQGIACDPAAGQTSEYALCVGPAAGPVLGSSPGNGCSGDSGAPVLGTPPSAGGGLRVVALLSGAFGATECGQAVQNVVVALGPTLSAWIGRVAGSPLPAPVAAPKRCVALRRSLAAARRSKTRALRRASSAPRSRVLRLRLAGARALVERRGKAVFRIC
jgi:secreted trypsin-like serine protease